MKISTSLSIIAFTLCAGLILFFSSCNGPENKKETPSLVEHIQVVPGFRVEHLYMPTDTSSWVAMTTDDKGRLLASDQYGALYRITPPPIGKDLAKIEVEKLDVEIGWANGMLWAFNSLYVVVNANPESKDLTTGRSSGFYRLRDTNGDEQFDEVTRLKEFSGHGEHGPHAVLLGPDGKSLYVLAGNHTDIPEGYTSLMADNWATDHLFETIPDARGHAIDRKPPGGWVARTDADGSFWEIVSSGYRNPYDMAFNNTGELFVFDADMEWDLGMPWYRPIRVCHAIPGSEYGWRTGSGKWPSYYPDNLPPVVNIGQGSPTGVVMGYGAAFPQKYQQGMFVFDWSFGTMYWVGMQADGSTYTGTVEEFLSGVPLPLTDGVIGSDGALYFATGGRRLESHLYRVVYEGEEAVDPISANVASSPEAQLRQQFAAVKGIDMNMAWEELANSDRFIRYAARVALEHTPAQDWVSNYWKTENPHQIIEGAVALARQGKPSWRGRIWRKLVSVDFASLSQADQLAMIRTIGLVGIRQGKPKAGVRRTITNYLNPHFPANTPELNKELCYLLAYLEAPEVIERTLVLLEGTNPAARHSGTYLSETVSSRSERYGPDVAKMLANMPPVEEIAYVWALSQVKEGWTDAQRKRYFQWFYDALQKSGGASYKGFLDQIRTRALDNMSNKEKASLADEFEQFSTYKAVNFADLPSPKGPGRNWNPRELDVAVRDAMKEGGKRNFEQGKRMYEATLCASCHAMRGKGSNIGPDLTQIGTRFSRNELARHIISPSDAISDQYAATLFRLKDGKAVSGRIVSENETEVLVNVNPFDQGQIQPIPLTDIESRSASPVSIMPPGLINRLSEAEAVDLMAYLLAGGNAEHEYFQ